jgi:hypothetical protein
MTGRTFPIGTEKMYKGYLFRKVANDGSFHENWRRVHRINYENANGPLPDDRVLKCLDGNKFNVKASNWKAVPKGLLIHLDGTTRGNRPAYGTAPAQLKPTILAVAHLRYEMLKTGPTTAQRAFLRLLKTHKTITMKHLPGADRAEQSVRMYCRRRGWAKFGRWAGDRRLGWRLTARGRAALSKCRISN